MQGLLTPAILVALGLGLAPLRAETACDGIPVSVSAADPAVAASVCGTAARALPQLSACHLTQLAPVRVEVVPEMPPDLPPCLAAFDCDAQTIRILEPSAVARLLDRSSAFSAVPAGEFHASLVVHELAHALAFQTRGARASSEAADEYIAYAMQIQFLSPASREAVIARHRPPAEVQLHELNDFVAKYAPAVFAVKAWLHFAEQDDGCGFVAKLLGGDG